MISYKFLKRILDLLIGTIALIITCIPMLVIACMVFITMGKPVFFTQYRTGKNGVPFKLYKFRTMDVKQKSDKRSSGERLTAMGKILRNTSLDEFPQFINVLRGDMSIIGPRPLLSDYDELYTKQERRRLEVRPGITGLAQVSGRSKLSWKEKFALDVSYVDNYTFKLDFKILIKTFLIITDRSKTTPKNGSIQERYNGFN